MDIHGKNIPAAGNVDIGTQNNYFGANPPEPPDTIPTITGFVGREDYLKDLRGDYENGTRSFVLYGGGGVGKSALALEFANEIKKNFEAKIFVEMRGMRENAYSWRDAMFEIIRQFNPQISADISDEHLKAEFTQLVQKQPTLIILDDAKSETEVVPLISRANACFIISSRNDIQTTNGTTTRLSAMSPEDAEKLLYDIVGSPEKFEGKALELAELAGYYPMALKPLAKLLKKKHGKISTILDEYRQKQLEITDTEHDNLSIEASFALSYDALTEDLREYWRLLSVFPADFESQAAATVFGTEFDAGEKILEQLYDYSVIEEDAKTTNEQTRYNLHDFAKLFTRKEISEEERANTQIRFALYYTMVVRDAIDIEKSDYINGFANAMQLVDSEWINITKGQHWSAKFSNDNNDFAQLCMEYSGLNTDMLSFFITPRQEIIWHESALASARKLQNKHAESFFLNNIGKAKIELGNYNDALQYLEQSLEIAQDIRQKGAVFTNLSKFYGIDSNEQRSIRKSAKYGKRALKIAIQLGDKKTQCSNLNNIGVAFLGNYNRFNNLNYRKQRIRPVWWYLKTIHYCEQAMILADEIGNREVAGASRSNIGRTFLVLENFKSAKPLFQEALEIQSSIKNPFGIAMSLTNLGCACIGLTEIEEACSMWNEALKIFEILESPHANEVRQWIQQYC